MKKKWLIAAAAAALVLLGGAAQAADMTKGEMTMDPTKKTAEPTKVVQTAGRTVLGTFAPKFAELNDDVLFGEVWSRTNLLSLRDRSLITVTALVAGGVTDSSLQAHLENAKRNGVTAEEMGEALTHVSFYAGWPKAWAAFRMAKDVYGDANIPAPAVAPNETAEGDPTKRTAEPSRVVQTAGRAALSTFAPKFAELNDDVLFGEVWSRTNVLSLRDRSLLTVTALIGSGITDSSLTYHLGEAKKNGITAEEMGEMLTHMAFYVGWPKAWAAFRQAKDVYAE